MNSDYDPSINKSEYASAPPYESRGESEVREQSGDSTVMKRLLVGSLALVLICGGMFASFGAGMIFEREVVADQSETADETVVFSNAWEAVQENYVQEEAINDDAMLEAAIEGMLATLGDEGHTRYLTAAETEADRLRSQGVYVGVGIEVEEKEAGEGLVVNRVFPDSPAEGGGIEVGDIVVAADGEDITTLTQEEAIQRIRGPIGTRVKLTVTRPSTGEELIFDLERQEIEISAVTWTILENNIALISLEQFSRRSSDDMANALQAAKDAGAESIILDLRGNPGGFVREAELVASMFLPDDAPIFIRRTREGGEETSRAEPTDVEASDLPLVVLIDHTSASASEIVSGALKSQAEDATLVGETTVGTGTVLEQFELGDGSTIWLGVELWLTPEGEMIREQGIIPDITVSLADGQRQFRPDDRETEPPEVEDLEDDQLEYAIDLLEDGEAALLPPPAPSSPGPTAW